MGLQYGLSGVLTWKTYIPATLPAPVQEPMLYLCETVLAYATAVNGSAPSHMSMVFWHVCIRTENLFIIITPKRRV